MSTKQHSFDDMKKNAESLTDTMMKRVAKMPAGSCFSRSDFSSLGTRLAVSQALSRLERAGILSSPVRGYYCRRRMSKLLKVEMPPDYAALAAAIARNSGWTIIPCGDIAANDLGLSTQVPAVWSYVSTGPYRTYEVGKMRLEFKHTANRELFNMSKKSALCVQAIKAFGKGGVTPEIVKRLELVLSKREKDTLLKETSRVTSWIYDVIKLIGKENDHA